VREHPVLPAISPLTPSARCGSPWRSRNSAAKVIVLHAAPPKPHHAVPVQPIPIDLDPVVLESKSNMDELEANPRIHGFFNMDGFWNKAISGNVIDAEVAKNKADLIVVATRGRHGLSKLVLGSNAEAIFRRATCPVLTAGPNVGFIDEQAWQPKKIVFATDFSASSLHALPCALSIAEENQAQLILFASFFSDPVRGQRRYRSRPGKASARLSSSRCGELVQARVHRSL